MSMPGCIRLYSGTYLNLLNPEPEMIWPIDIAVGLARECRWGNHSKRFYSVAEHSIECMRMAEEKYPGDSGIAMGCLLHDAHEAYLKDVPTPFKAMLPDYAPIADYLQRVIHLRFGVDHRSATNNPRISEIDRLVLKAEWETKMLRWEGLQLDEKARVDLFIHHLVRLTRHPIAIMP